MNISFSPPDISEIEISEVIDTLRSGWITTGPKTKLFENQIAKYVNSPKAACLNSATAAMELCLRILGVGEGDEVITTSYTYTASASVIHHVGARIVLVDTGKDSYQLDYIKLEEAITERTKVIIPVDIAGVMCDYDKIADIVDRKKNMFSPSNSLQNSIGKIVVLADAAHSFGATYKGRNSGEVADFTCFSFHAVKNLTTSEGGAVVWKNIDGIDNDELYKQFMMLSLHGQSKDALEKNKLGAWEYDILFPAFKCNMTDIMASIGIGQLKRYPDILERRRELIGIYDRAFKGYNNMIDTLKHYDSEFSSSGHLYFIRLIGKDEKYRNNVIESLAKHGITTNVHYKPLPMHTAYKNMGFEIKKFPNAFDMYKNEISLPLHTTLSNEQVQYVADSLISIITTEKQSVAHILE
jgi:dTDP-4-amino-4,6-dideoxygalactose transaminase